MAWHGGRDRVPFSFPSLPPFCLPPPAFLPSPLTACHHHLPVPSPSPSPSPPSAYLLHALCCLPPLHCCTFLPPTFSCLPPPPFCAVLTMVLLGGLGPGLHFDTRSTTFPTYLNFFRTVLLHSTQNRFWHFWFLGGWGQGSVCPLTLLQTALPATLRQRPHSY